MKARDHLPTRIIVIRRFEVAPIRKQRVCEDKPILKSKFSFFNPGMRLQILLYLSVVFTFDR